MRKLFYFFACFIMMTACSNEDVPTMKSSFDVSFNLTGDYVEITETPLISRAQKTTKTFYAIQIEEVTTEKLFKTEEQVKKNYAYGIFSDIKNARISLPKGKYVFNALIIEEREDVIFNKDGHYSRPFCSGGLYDSNYEDMPMVTDVFTKTDAFGLDLLNSDFTQETMNSSIKMARIDRFYGTKEIDLESEEQISIDMDRFAFAFTYNVVPPIDGTIYIKAPDFGRTFYTVKKEDNQESKQIIYNAPIKEKSETYDLNLKIIWERGSAELEQYEIEKTIKIERNKNYILNIDMNARDNEQSFDLNVETTFTDENHNIN